MLNGKELLGFLWKDNSMASLFGELFPFASCLRWSSRSQHTGKFFSNAIQEALPCAHNSSTCGPTCNTKSTWNFRHPVGAPSDSSWEPSSCWSQSSLRYRETHSRVINLHPSVRAAKHGCYKQGELKSWPWGPQWAKISAQPGRIKLSLHVKTLSTGQAGQKSWRMIHQDRI